jgi:hypothetical protein
VIGSRAHAVIPAALLLVLAVGGTGPLVPRSAAATAGTVTPLAPLPPGTPESFRQRLAEIYSDFYGVPRSTVDLLLRAGLPDDDVSVICLLSVMSTESTNALALYRLQKLSWADVFERLRTPGRLLAPQLRSRPAAERFARPLAIIAADPERPPRLTDDQVRDLVQLRVAVEYYALDPAVVAAWRDQGIASTRILLSQHVAAGGRSTGRRLQPAHGAPAASQR